MKTFTITLHLFFCLVLARPKLPTSDSSESIGDYIMFDTQSVIEQQIPEDIVFDLIGRATLITEDAVTEKKKTFLLKPDEHGFPYVIDPVVHNKYIIQYSVISPDIDIFREISELRNNEILVVEPISDRLFIAKLNKYKEVKVTPVQVVGSHNATISRIIQEKGIKRNNTGLNLLKKG